MTKPSRLYQMGQILTAMMGLIINGTTVEIKRKGPRRKGGCKSGFIHNTIHHASSLLIDRAGICSPHESEAARYAGGDLRIRVAWRVLQIMPKYLGWTHGDPEKERIVVEALRCLNGVRPGAAE